MSKKKEYDPIVEENEEIESPRMIKNYNGRSSREVILFIKKKKICIIVFYFSKVE